VRIDGTGRYSVRVEADGAVTLRNVRFAVRTPSAEHARLAPVAGMPAAGTPSTLSAVVGAGATDVKFLLVDEEGTTLATPALAQQDPDAGADRFVGTFTPPSEPFRVAITAKDATGCALRRTWPALFVPSTLRVHVDPASVSAGLTAGTMTTIGVTVFNDGPAGTFDVVATDDDGRITRVAPASVALATGAHADVQIDLPVSADERLGASVGLAIAAVEDGGTRANTTTASIPVTTGTLALGLRQRLLRDRPTAGGDTVNVSGRLVFDTESRDAQIDPATDRLHVEVGDPSNPFVLNVPAGDPAWRTTSKGLVTWKAAAGATPQGSVVIDPRRRSFTLKLSKFDFPAPPGPAARVTLRAGDDVGTAAIARRR
jgi:lipoprotein-anchoring transpeptidase ErfK/SrfK